MAEQQPTWATRVSDLRQRLGLGRRAFGRLITTSQSPDGVAPQTVMAWERNWWLPHAEAQRRLEELEQQP